jgi:hypothetical protein
VTRRTSILAPIAVLTLVLVAALPAFGAVNTGTGDAPQATDDAADAGTTGDAGTPDPDSGAAAGDEGAPTGDGVGTEEAPAEGVAEEGGEEGATGEEEGAPLEFETPAVSIAEEPPEEVVQPWTIRYLVPTTVALAGILVFGTVVQYFLKVVRARYKTVE